MALMLTSPPSISNEVTYPEVTLDNGVMQVIVLLPDAEKGFYRGKRFDWSGVIGKVIVGDHQFYTTLYENHDPDVHDSISGPAEEFGMFHPMGYAEAAPGESFVKIGVGLLERIDDTAYRFDEDYPFVRRGRWDIDQGRDWIRFEQKLVGERSWSYQYEKVIRLLPGKSELVIEHKLINSGSKKIDLFNYNHNFTLIDDVPFGPDYQVEFPFDFRNTLPNNDIVEFTGNTLSVNEPLGNQALWHPVFEGEDPGHYNAAVVHNNRTGASVAFEGDIAISRMVFWAVERAVSVEPFIKLVIEPGQSKQWQTQYRYIVKKTAKDS
ncbi:MAG: hypothetical protein ACI845_003060 [Gammaproteobacteria bacterium]|jgi:hypothetical protein